MNFLKLLHGKRCQRGQLVGVVHVFFVMNLKTGDFFAIKVCKPTIFDGRG